MKVRLLKDQMAEEKVPAGTVLEGQAVWLLVELGQAKPADAECAAFIKSRGRVAENSYLLDALDLIPDVVEDDAEIEPAKASKGRKHDDSRSATTLSEDRKASEDQISVG